MALSSCVAAAAAGVAAAAVHVAAVDVAAADCAPPNHPHRALATATPTVVHMDQKLGPRQVLYSRKYKTMVGVCNSTIFWI